VLLLDGRYVYPPADSDSCIRRTPDEADRPAAPGPAGAAAGATRSVRGEAADAVLKADEVEALLSLGGEDLLRRAAEECRVPLGARERPCHLLRGFVVRRRARVLLPGEPFYSPARISEVVPLPAPTPGRASRWLLRLTAIVDGAAREEPPTPLRLLSNETGGAGSEEWAVPAGADARKLHRALRAADLTRLMTVRRSGSAAIDRWRRLLLGRGLHEHEAVAGDPKRVLVGEFSYHRAFYARLHHAQSAFLKLFEEFPDEAYRTFLMCGADAR